MNRDRFCRSTRSLSSLPLYQFPSHSRCTCVVTLRSMHGTDKTAQPPGPTQRDEALHSDANPNLADLAPPPSPLSRYSSAADTQHDEVRPLSTELELSHSSPLLAGDALGFSSTQLRRRNIQPRSTAPPGPPATSLNSQDDTPQSFQPLTPPDPFGGLDITISFMHLSCPGKPE